MPYLPTPEAFLHQSHLLLSARPSTAKVTTTYRVHRAPSTPPPPTSSTSDAAATPRREKNKALLTLRTYDPVSGVCLKYKTSKAWEVGRLIKGLGGLGRGMSGLEPKEEGEGDVMEGVEGDDAGKGKGGDVEKVVEKEKGKGQGGGGKGKKKKGKR